MTTGTERLSARERLLAAADALFYEEGIHAVGIDRVIERAGVAKASLYNTFGSKDELVRAYLTVRHDARVGRIERAMAAHTTARDKLLGIFDAMAESHTDPRFRGCAFVNANAEARPGGPEQELSELTRQWTRSLFTDLCREAGARDPEQLARQLVLLYDGANVSAQLDRNPGAAVSAKAAAAALLAAGIDQPLR